MIRIPANALPFEFRSGICVCVSRRLVKNRKHPDDWGVCAPSRAAGLDLLDPD
jgi:hypothetical protein